MVEQYLEIGQELADFVNMSDGPDGAFILDGYIYPCKSGVIYQYVLYGDTSQIGDTHNPNTTVVLVGWVEIN